MWIGFFRLPVDPRQLISRLVEALSGVHPTYLLPLLLSLTLKMGGVFSSYAGSNDIVQFASLSEEDSKKYDYVICGGKSI